MRKMYFVGVTTAQSSIHRIFPAWVRSAGLDDAVLAGIDLAIDAPAADFRRAVEMIRMDPACWGALVTTHKIPVFEHARDLFTEFDPDAERLGEVSCIVRRASRLRGEAVDTLTAALALRAIGCRWPLPAVLILGAGGAAIALATVLAREWPSTEVVLTDLSQDRLDRAGRLTRARCLPAAPNGANDRQLEAMPPGALIVNATGMGKDRPGSPIGPQARFPRGTVAWDFNYRGDLQFLEAARAQGIRAVDGWEYFLHGWSQIMSHVFGFDLSAGLFSAMRQAADLVR